ncbi:serine/threonine-protein kinase [Jatrophihabitans endophyticus]|uniref:serine/threonine-protein kinase n=1 Tax=Jatrophihabitans endophyticus TaxID=1206085 RepID=UPI0026F1D8D8|nr:serine/threonine protein kinase [Jatrophihabitans endophyticus]
MSEQFGHYVLEDVIGRGGMGEVYRAYDTKRDRTVALKRLPKEMASDETFQARFRRECQLVARLNEPHVIPIHDFGEIEGHLYLDMRLVEGVDLSTILGREGPLDPKLAVDIIGQVAAALQSAHDSGLVHRDIKPSNILLTGMSADRQSVFAYLVDFGIARTEAGGGTALTATTGTVGTLGYMAPERISGGDGDHRSDVYSLACVLFECLTGHAPFRGETFQVMFAHVNAPPPLPSVERRGLPRSLDNVIRTGLAKDPAARYQTPDQFASAARAALATGGVTPPPAASPAQRFGVPPGPQTQGAQARPPFTPRPAPQGPPVGPQTPPPLRSGPPSGPIGNRPPSGPVGNRPPSGPIGARPPSGPVGTRPPSGPIGNRPPSGPIGQPPMSKLDSNAARIRTISIAVMVLAVVAVILVVALH